MLLEIKRRQQVLETLPEMLLEMMLEMLLEMLLETLLEMLHLQLLSTEWALSTAALAAASAV